MGRMPFGGCVAWQVCEAVEEKKRQTKSMQIGFVNFSQDELARKNKVLQMVRDQTAIDELGLGRIRDAFANLMFPGMSVLQRRAKYFVVLPSLFFQATKREYADVRAVRRHIVKMEIRLTEMLKNGAGGDQEKLKGITGISMLDAARKDPDKFVKLDPAYIYMSGMRTYGLLEGDADIYRLIYERSQRRRLVQSKYKAEEEGEMSDSDDREGQTQFFKISGENYDFEKGEALSLDFTRLEADFLKNHIINSKESKDSLLAYLLRNDVNVCPEYDSLETEWRTMPADFGDFLRQYRLGRRFSHLAYVLQLRYNHIMETYSEREQNAEALQAEIVETMERYAEDFTSEAVGEMLSYIMDKLTEQTGVTFCREAIRSIERSAEDPAAWGELDELIVRREKAVKPGRIKLKNPMFKGEKRSRPKMMSFRWNEIVYSVIKDIREAK